MTEKIITRDTAQTNADVIEILVSSVTEQIQKLDQIPERLISVQGELADIRKNLHTFAPRKEVKRARWRMFLLIIGLVLGLQAVQSTEVTNCFLNTSTKSPAVCRVIYPGYSKAVAEQRKRASDLRDEVAAQQKFDNQVLQYKDALDKANTQLKQEITKLQQEITQLQQGH